MASVNYDFDDVINKVDNVSGVYESSEAILKVNQSISSLSNYLQTDEKGMGLDSSYDNFEAVLNDLYKNVKSAYDYLGQIKNEAVELKRIQEEEEAAKRANEANTADSAFIPPNVGTPSYVPKSVMNPGNKYYN